MFDALEITRLQDEATLRWHGDEPWPDPLTFVPALDPHPAQRPPATFMEIVLANHRANFDLWHEEDKAREPEVADRRIAGVKRAIDKLNQKRNDLVETMDRSLLQAAGLQNPAAPLHSETPGLIIDRLSILALKIYHTAEEIQRPSASDAHHEKCRNRLCLLEEQRGDLADCLNLLWSEVLNRQRRFKLYRQMKMYNDPELNPSVYAHKGSLKPG
jgi:hypothetical protein